MEKKNLARKVELYLQRTMRDTELEKYPLNEIAHWRVIGGARGDFGVQEPTKEVLYGKFIDALAYAVQQSEFYGDWCAQDDPSNRNHGGDKKEKVNMRL